MSLRLMSHVKFKKGLCRRVEFRGLGPLSGGKKLGAFDGHGRLQCRPASKCWYSLSSGKSSRSVKYDITYLEKHVY